MKWLPRNPFLQVACCSLLGMFFPVCECGVVPLTRRFLWKGLPPGGAMAFLLAAPVLNPVVIASTYAAFGVGPVFWGRMAGTLVVAIVVGLVFTLQPDAKAVLRLDALPQAEILPTAELVTPVKAKSRLRELLVIASDEFFEMGRYLVLGSALAALLQTFVPQQALLSVGRGPLGSVLVLIALAVLLSVCSTVDAFIALAFVGTFSGGAILAFLVYGPMVDIKSTLMFLRAFNRKTVVYLVLLPLAMTVVLGVVWNLLIG